MGNHLVGIAPSQIYPVEHYLMGSFESDLQYESSMGSTRFFKVARVRSDEGLIVIKVFVKHDPSLPLETHADRVMYIQKALANAVNCLPFQRVQVTEKVALVMREYVKHSLYDRVSTRPFLTSLEKKWITFQVLCALHQCHRQKICHGDIKLENILITSWNWILLSDFASFKPTYLPEDNPADYTYFFDTSRRRTCYVAPERFVKSLSNDANNAKSGILIGGSSLLSASIMDSLQSNDQNNTANLLPEMDIFSAGCALLELWSEGTAPFEFSQLLAYRSGDLELVTKHLEQLENENLRNLIASMISRNPSDRKSAEVYLDEQRGKLFPEYFYTFLQSYMQMFSSLQILPPDDKIMRLYSDIKQIIDIFLPSNNEQENRTIPDDDGLILITAVVTSCIRGLKYCKTKLHCLEILQQLSMYTTSETVLDRILPYILHLCSDPAARVRVSALDTLSMCIRLVKDLPRNDANIFPEYVLPTIAPLAMDNSVVVRIAYARNVADIAETALYFLDQTQLNAAQELPTIRYETELSALHEMLHQTVSHLLTDAQPIVKQTVIECGVTKLCVFFGRQKANDLILSHMITFLNDKEDKSLRGSFFDCIVGVATFVGWQCSDILLPLLQQGLTDSEEFVIAKAIRATTALTGLGLIQKPTLSEFITECACYLNHPNLWIRHEVCGLISSAANIFGAIDVQCKIMPAIINHLKCPLIQVEKPEILMDCLQLPIPRNIYDSVVRFTELESFFTLLEERKKARDSTIESLPQHCEMTSPVRNFFRRITCEGLTDTVEKQILSMKSSILKLNKYLKKVPADKYSTNGKIFIDSKLEIGKELVLVDNKKQLISNRKSDADNANLDWQRMYTHSDKSTSPLSDYHSSGVNSSAHYNDTPSTSLVEYSMPEKNFIQERNSDCRNELHMLHNKLKGQYILLNANSDSNAAMKRASMIPPGHRIKGTLIAHLHEHKSAVTKLTALNSSSSLFASASTDGTVRLFDCNKLNGHQSINKSRQMYSANVPIYSIAACDSGQSLAVAGNDGSLLLLQIDPNSSKMALQQARHLVQNSGGYNGYDDGPIVDMHPLDPDSQSVIIYATLYGAIICWDLRMPTNAWRLNSDLKQGVITTFCIDSNVSWMATGTSHGNHICHDLRFKLPIAKIQHPAATRIRKIIPHPTESSWLISTSHGNNEVSVWNIETGHRQAALWASSAPPLSKESVGHDKKSKNTSSVCGIVSCIVNRSPVLFTGSSDQRIRYWDLSTRSNCSMISPASRDYASGSNFSYDSRLIDGTRVIYEVQMQNKSHAVASGMPNSLKSDDYSPRSGPEMPLPCHNNVITDLLICRTQKYPVLISSSRDGVIKLWK